VTKLNIDNFLGKDTYLKAAERISESDRYVNVGLENRDFCDNPYFIGTDVKGRLWQEDEFNLAGGGADLYFGRRVTDFTKATLKYSFDDIKISDTDFASDTDFNRYKGSNSAAVLDLLLSRSTLDDPFYPQAGTRLAFDASMSAKAIGSDFNYMG
jgi:outer membrane protein assembly factor BamA